MPALRNITTLNNWWINHTRWGGCVFHVEMQWKDVTSPEQYVDSLFKKYKQLPFEDILAFSESDVTDNSMPNREIMEDASKIYMLRDSIRNNNMQFLPQIIHEPWRERYRIHPGSGRAAAMWLEGYDTIKGIYIHFNEHPFLIPKSFEEIYTPEEMMQAVCFQKIVEPDFEWYEAFPKIHKECLKTNSMDKEWQWHHIKTYRPWRFLRWSEGNNFLKHKYTWRSYAIDLWHELN